MKGKGGRNAIRNEIKGVRSKVTGRRSVGVKDAADKADQLDEVVQDDAAEEKEAALRHLEEVTKRDHAIQAKFNGKVEAYVKTKLDAERNKRLRNGNPLKREERAALESKLRVNARVKYSSMQDKTLPADSSAQSSAPADEVARSQEQRQAEFAHRTALLDQATELHRTDLQAREMQMQAREELLQAREQEAREQALMEAERMRARMQEQGDDDDEHSLASSGEHADDFMHSTPRPSGDTAHADAHGVMPSPLVKLASHSISNETPPSNDAYGAGQAHDDRDQEWWASEQAKWQADMQGDAHGQQHPQNGSVDQEKDTMQRSRRELLPHFDAQAEGGAQDDRGSQAGDSKKVIRLRTYTISKKYEAEALGVQFYTPDHGPGVRITAMNAIGPFGRCGDLEDDDVLVEINGRPVLYAGHAGVITCIKDSFRNSNQMSVTVCRPMELNKLEEIRAAGTAGESSAKKKAFVGISNFITKATKVTMTGLSGILSNRSDAAKMDTTPTKPTGTFKGAPAWWAEAKKKNPKATKAPKAKDAAGNVYSDVASEHSGSNDGSPVCALGETGSPNHLDGTYDVRAAAAAHSHKHDSMEPKQSAAYLIYRADVRDLEAYKHNYMDVTTALIKQFGGRWLARGGKITTLEGSDTANQDLILQRMVLIEFPNMDAAKAFFHSEEYQEARQQRLSIATAELTVLEGMPIMAE